MGVLRTLSGTNEIQETISNRGKYGQNLFLDKFKLLLHDGVVIAKVSVFIFLGFRL